MKKVTSRNSKSRTAQNDWEPMRPCILLDSLGDGITKCATIRGAYDRGIGPGDAPKNNLSVPLKFDNGIEERLRQALPKDQAVVVMAEHPIARRIRDRSHKLRKAYIVASVDEFLDLVFHKRVNARTPNDPKLSDGGAWRGSCEGGAKDSIRTTEKGGSK